MPIILPREILTDQQYYSHTRNETVAIHIFGQGNM